MLGQAAMAGRLVTFSVVGGKGAADGAGEGVVGQGAMAGRLVTFSVVGGEAASVGPGEVTGEGVVVRAARGGGEGGGSSWPSIWSSGGEGGGEGGGGGDIISPSSWGIPSSSSSLELVYWRGVGAVVGRAGAPFLLLVLNSAEKC